MIGHQLRKCPAVEQWAEALDSSEALPASWETHVEQCPRCRETLACLASDSEFANEMQQRLSFESAEAPSFGSKILALSGCERTADCTEGSEHELSLLRQWLEPASHPELIGTLGRYELHQLVGRGGMGLVFRARDLELQRVVAVKTLTLHLASLSAARERFAREGRAIASLSHPHIVQVYDVVTDQRVPALVMQYVPGQTLEDRIEAQGSISVDDTLRIAGQLLSALAAAHDSGLVHRDIKPGNVLLEADGSRGLLSDFGLVRALDDASLTHSGFLAGTPHYMSPEQARGAMVDARSDLFSFGSLVYTMLAGHPPFRAPEPMAVLHRICNEPQRPLHQVDSRIPLELSRWVDRLLAKNTERRFATATEARDALLKLSKAPRRMIPGSTRSLRQFISKHGLRLLAAIAVIGIGISVFPRAEPEATRERAATGLDIFGEGLSNPGSSPIAKADFGSVVASTGNDSTVNKSTGSSSTAGYQQIITHASDSLDERSTFADLDVRIQQLSTDVEGLMLQANESLEPLRWSDMDESLRLLDSQLQELKQER